MIQDYVKIIMNRPFEMAALRSWLIQYYKIQDEFHNISYHSVDYANITDDSHERSKLDWYWDTELIGDSAYIVLYFKEYNDALQFQLSVVG